MPKGIKSWFVFLTALFTGQALSGAPLIGVQVSSNQVLLTWPLDCPSLMVEENSQLLNASNWTPVAGVRFSSNNLWHLTTALTSSNRFFRLRSDPLAPDFPDSSFLDTDCDGIDGSLLRAIFVAPAPFGQPTNDGSALRPLSSLQGAIALAAASSTKKQIYVAQGNYNLTNSLVLSSGVSLYGLYDGTTNWSRAGGYTTTINGTNMAVVGINLTAPVRIEGFSIVASSSSTSSGSSYVVHLTDSGTNLVLAHNILRASDGTAGLIQGVPGTNGVSGLPGNPGAPGSCDGDSGGLGGAARLGPCGVFSGGGGRGGNAGQNGFSGSASADGTLGGNGGSVGNPGGDGAHGVPGAAGVNGSPGRGGTNFGLVVSGQYVAANATSGFSGTAGRGGGGGGGGGSQSCTFCNDGGGNGGGSGGTGGCPAGGGGGGIGGGGSFGVFLVNSSPTLLNNNIVTGRGGNGSNGGPSGTPGPGGTGGMGSTVCPGEVGTGGNGGDGGRGGAGGGGGGGGGGPSIGIYRSGSSTVVTTGNSITFSPGGSGGAGGTNTAAGGSAPNGMTGLSAAVYLNGDPFLSQFLGRGFRPGGQAGTPVLPHNYDYYRY